MMTKRDYEKAAEIVRNSPIAHDTDKEIYSPAIYIMQAFVELFSNDNPRFDAARFKKACEL